MLLQQRGLKAYIETRAQIAETRYRVPDVCAYLKKESIFTIRSEKAYTSDATGLLPATRELRTADGGIALSLDEIFLGDF